MNLKKVWKIIKTLIFILAGVLVLIFAKPFVNDEGANINLYVGIVMLFYGVEKVTILLIKKEYKQEQVKFLNAFINILLGIIMIVVIENNTHEVRIACTIWCIWSLMREGEEIFEKVLEGFKEHPITSIINLVESIVVIVFSIIFLRVEEAALVEDALLHVYLLGVELILEVLWEPLAKFETKIKNRKISKLD